MSPKDPKALKKMHGAAVNVIQGLQMVAKRDDLDIAVLFEIAAMHLLAARLFAVSDDEGKVPDVMIDSVLARVSTNVKTHVKGAARRRQPPHRLN